MSFDFYEELHSSQIREPELMALCGIDKRTLQRWLKTNTCPIYAQTIIKCYGYDLGFIHKDWQGSYIAAATGKLWPRDSLRPFTKGNINVLSDQWPKLHWYYEVWLREQANPESYYTRNRDDENTNVVQFDLPFKKAAN